MNLDKADRTVKITNYLACLFTKDKETFSPYSVNTFNQKLTSSQLNQLTKIIGCGSSYPITCGFILSFPTLMSSFLDRRFPTKVLGLIHLKSEFDNSSTLNFLEPCDIEVSVISHEYNDKGRQVTTETTFRQKGRKVLVNRNTFLRKLHRAMPKQQNLSDTHTTNNHAADTYHELESTNVSLSDIRRYALASGDYNPIHLSHITARLFGFKQAIAHGMYLANLVSHKHKELLNSNKLNIEFKKPCYLPSKIAINQKGKKIRIESKISDKTISHLIFR